MKRIFGVALGILTAIGGFVDIGDLVTNSVVGARFGLSLAWVLPLGVLGICLYAQMAGRVAAVSGRTTFEIIRSRLGPRAAVANLAGSFIVNLLTITAEIGGIALALQLASGVGMKRWVPLAVLGIWLVVWRVKFRLMENGAGLLGLALIVFPVSVFLLHPDWSDLGRQVSRPGIPQSESALTYWYFAVALFGAAMTPYEVFFFSSGAAEEGWSTKDLGTSRLNVMIGFPLGGLLSLSIATSAAIVLAPMAIDVTSLSQTVAPVVVAGGQVALAFVIVGVLAATSGAALETTLSAGYMVAQFFGWTWGKYRRPATAARFHVTMMLVLLAGGALMLIGLDPVMVTEYSVVFSAVALPLTYLPILLIANDPDYMGERVNGKVMNFFAVVYLLIIVTASLAAIPLIILTGAGQ